MKSSQFSVFSLLLYGYLAFVLVSCATPRSILRMNPVQENPISQQVFWQNGTPFIQSVTDSIGVRVGFGFFDNQQQLMHVQCEFINFSDRPILIAPEKFYYRNFDTTQNMPMFTQHIAWAIDPEKRILDLEKGIARKEASAKNNQGWAIAGAVVAVTAVAVISSQNKSNTNNRSSSLANDASRTNNTNTANTAALAGTAGLLTARIANDNAMIKRWQVDNDEMLKKNWENLTLRKTHLFPQESIKGTILFPVQDEKYALKYLRFFFPVEHTNQSFAFKQQWINSEIMPNGNFPTH